MSRDVVFVEAILVVVETMIERGRGEGRVFTLLLAGACLEESSSQSLLDFCQVPAGSSLGFRRFVHQKNQ
jgi:hypothetical protein